MAYWLDRAGMTPVIVEAAPAVRTGGYMIDFWGLGFSVAEAMGLGERLREIGYVIHELKLLDGHGRVTTRLAVDAIMGATNDRYVSVLRGDLARELNRVVSDRVETLVGNTVTSVSQDRGGVDVTFSHAPPRRFDLVIGADGLHSSVRTLVFGPEDNFALPLGYRFAAFTAADYPHRDELAYVSRTVPGRQIVRCTLRDARTVFFMIVASELINGPSALAGLYADIGSEAGEIIEAIERSDDLYFDTVSQVHMPTWSRGRVALIGDAAYCPSLLAGEGSSFAMAGAYLLAGELASAGRHYGQAFQMYEQRFRPFIDHKQRAARRLGGWFAPRTQTGLFVRNQLTRLAAIPGLSSLLVGPMVAHDLPMPAYQWDRTLVRASA